MKPAFWPAFLLQYRIPVFPHRIIPLLSYHLGNDTGTPVVVYLELLEAPGVYNISTGVGPGTRTDGGDTQLDGVIPEYRAFPRRQGQLHLLVQQPVGTDELDQFPVAHRYFGNQAARVRAESRK